MHLGLIQRDRPMKCGHHIFRSLCCVGECIVASRQTRRRSGVPPSDTQCPNNSLKGVLKPNPLPAPTMMTCGFGYVSVLIHILHSTGFKLEELKNKTHNSIHGSAQFPPPTVHGFVIVTVQTTHLSTGSGPRLGESARRIVSLPSVLGHEQSIC